MDRVASVIRYRLVELRNEAVDRPATVLLWLPRTALLAFTSFLLYRWLLSGAEFRLAVVFAGLPVLWLALCVAIGYRRVFAAREDALLLTSPLSTTQFLLAKWAEVLISVLEVATFIGVPVLLAVSKTTSFPEGLLVFSSLMLNMLLACLVAIPGTLLSARAACLSRRTLLLSTAALLAAIGTAMALLIIPHLSINTTSFRLPHWFWDRPVPVLACQIALLAITGYMALRYASSTYMDVRSRLYAGRRQAAPGKTAKAAGSAFLARFQGSGYAILARDTLMNSRSPMQWLRAVLMLGLLSLYPLVGGWFRGGAMESLLALNVSFACLLGFVLIGEVVGNAFSAELNRIRLLLGAPIPAWKIMLAKFSAYFVPSVVLCGSSVLILDFVSGLPLAVIVYSVLLTSLITAGMVGLLVGMGTLSAKPDRDSRGGMEEFMAEQAFFTDSTSFLAFVLGGGVMALNAFLVTIPVLLQSRGVDLGIAGMPLTVFLTLEANLLIAALSLSCGSRRLAKLVR